IKDYTLFPRPFVLCLADEEELKVGEQFMSRVVLLRTDQSIEQTEAVKIRQAQIAKEGKNKVVIDKELLVKLKQHIKTMPSFSTLKYIHPVADMFIDVIPSYFTDARRDFPKYLDNVYGIARYHWKERIIGKNKAGDNLLFITPQDIYLNHLIYGQVSLESSLKCSSMERTMIEIIRSAKGMLKARDVQREMKKEDTTLSVHMVARHLGKLSDIGYIEREKKNNITHYSPGEVFESFTTHIDWTKVVKGCKEFIRINYPSIYKKYNDTYCHKPMVIHPFSGQQLNLLEIREEIPKAVAEGLDKFDKKDKNTDTNIIHKIVKKNELSGLLNYGLEGLKRLLKNGKFSFKKSWREIKEIIKRRNVY
ncbi:hypothetical protein LCGC14_2585190, partial [marine sediment metagenome]